MARYPGARWRPVARYQPGGRACVAMGTVRRLSLHTAVSAASSLYPYFSVPGRATSHLYVAFDGDCEQYIDTAFRSTAQLQGNPDTITVETQDMGDGFPHWSGSNVPAWTAAQTARLADIAAWAHKTEGVKLQLCPDSRPGSEGISWHRQGIDPWRVAGGELWSKARGKVCPGDRRLAQIPGILARARQIAEGDDMTPEQVEAAVITGVDKALNASRMRALDRQLTAEAVERLLNTSRIRELFRQQVDAATADINQQLTTLTEEVRALRSELAINDGAGE